MKKIIKDINYVLAEWNPIGVPENISLNEYKDYVPIILFALQKKENIIKVLEDILINKMNLDYDSNNKKNVEDLIKISENILYVYNSNLLN